MEFGGLVRWILVPLVVTAAIPTWGAPPLEDTAPRDQEAAIGRYTPDAAKTWYQANLISVQPTKKTVISGETFRVTAKGANSAWGFGTQADQGYITLSVLYEEDRHGYSNRSDLEIENVQTDCNEGPTTRLPGEDCYQRDGSLGECRHFLVEGAEIPWDGAHRKQISFDVTPNRSGTIYIRARVTLNDYGDIHSNDFVPDDHHADGTDTDHQGWKTARMEVYADERVNLEPIEPRVNDAIVFPGDRLRASIRIRNTESGRAPDSELHYYLSEDLSASTHEYKGDDTVSALGSGAYDDESESFTVQQDDPRGSVNVLFVSDPGEYIRETNEKDNQAHSPVTVAEPEVRAGDTDRRRVWPGQVMTFHYDVYNPDNEARDIWLGASLRHAETGNWIDDEGNDKKRSFEAQRVDDGSRPFRIPENAKPGLYHVYWGLWSGRPGDTIQFDEHRKSRYVEIVEVLPDLAIASLSVSDPVVYPEDRITSEAKVENVGEADAESTELCFYFSESRQVPENARAAKCEPVRALADGDSARVITALEVPDKDGAWYLIAKVDWADDVEEPDESNNKMLRSVMVEGPSIEDRSFSPQSVVPGESVSLEYLVKNPDDDVREIGLGASLQPGDGGERIDDPANDTVVSLKPDRSLWQSRPFNVPSATEAGCYEVMWGLHRGQPSDTSQVFETVGSDCVLEVLPTYEVSGVVRSARWPKSGVPRAEVKVLERGTGDMVRDATTGPEGRYVVSHVPEGTYTVQVCRDGWWVSGSARCEEQELQVHGNRKQDFGSLRSKAAPVVELQLDRDRVAPGATVNVTVTLRNESYAVPLADAYLDLSFAPNIVAEVGQPRTEDDWDVQPVPRYEPNGSNAIYEIVCTEDGGEYQIMETHTDWLVAGERTETDLGFGEKLSFTVPVTIAKSATPGDAVAFYYRGTVGDARDPAVRCPRSGDLVDQQGWIVKTRVLEVVQPTVPADLHVQVQGFFEDPVSGAECLLYDAGWDFLSETTSDQSGDCSWSQLPEGEYIVEVYDPERGALDGRSFWGTVRNIGVGGGRQASVEVIRDRPILRHVQVRRGSQSGPPLTAGAKLRKGEEAWLVATVRHRLSTPQTVHLNVIADRDEARPYDLVRASDAIDVGPGETKTVALQLRPRQRGQYSIAVQAKQAVNEQPTETDETGWSKSFRVAAEAGRRVFYEDFANRFLSQVWELQGSQKPTRHPGAHGRSWVFESRGARPCGAGAYSKSAHELGGGFLLSGEIYLKPNSVTSEDARALIGLSTNPGEWADCPVQHKELIAFAGFRHFGNDDPDGQFELGYVTESGRRVTAASDVEKKEGRWHQVEIMINPDKTPTFYVNDQLVYAGDEPITEAIRLNQHVWIGDLSREGDVYHDWVKLIQYGERPEEDKDQDGHSVGNGDCDDNDPQVHPDAAEKCDGVDNDCDGKTDESFALESDEAVVGSTVSLESSGRGDGATTEYSWSFASRPEGSQAEIEVPSSPDTRFMPDVRGTYLIRHEQLGASGNCRLTKTVTARAPGEPGLGGKPIIRSVRSFLGKHFLCGVDFDNTYRVTVDWQGQEPGEIEYSINGGTPVSVNADAQGGAFKLNMGKVFTCPPESDLLGLPMNNRLDIRAVSATEVASLPHVERPSIFGTPSYIDPGFNIDVAFAEGTWTYSLGAEFPPEPLIAGVEMPSLVPYIGGGPLGLYGAQVRVALGVNTKGVGSVAVAGKAAFKAAKGSVGGEIRGRGTMQMREDEGLVLLRAGFGLTLEGTIAEDLGIVEVIPALAGYSNIWGVKWINKNAMVEASISPKINADLHFTQGTEGNLEFEKATYGGEIGAELGLKIGKKLPLNFKAYGGGAIGFTGQVPPPYLRTIDTKLYFGAQLSKWGFNIVDARVGYKCSYDLVTEETECESSEEVEKERAADESGGMVRITPKARDHLWAPGYGKRGRDVLVAGPDKGISQRVLVEAVPAGAEPNITVTSDGSVVVTYIYDDPLDEDLQSTEVFYLERYRGSWEGPNSVTNDTRGEFSPSGAAVGESRRLVAWERIKDEDYSEPMKVFSDLGPYAGRLEVVAAEYDSGTGAWGEVVPLTHNEVLDHDARVIFNESGSATVVWRRSKANEGAGDAEDGGIYLARSWEVEGFGPIERIGGEVRGDVTFDAGGGGDRSWLVVHADGDGDFDTVRDQELWCASKESGVWSELSRLTDDGVVDRSPTLLDRAKGVGQLYWIRDGDVVTTGLNGTCPGGLEREDVTVVRETSRSIRFSDLSVEETDEGHVVLVWQSQQDGSGDLFLMTRDASTGDWSTDRRLTDDEPLENYVDLALDRRGNVLVVFLHTDQVREDYEMEFPSGRTVIPGVPAEGFTSLELVEASLARDARAGAISVHDTKAQRYGGKVRGGTDVEICTEVENVGELSVLEVAVEFYEGGCTNGGGRLIGGTEKIPGLRAGEAVTGCVDWQTPADVDVVEVCARLVYPEGRNDVQPGNDTVSRDVQLVRNNVPAPRIVKPAGDITIPVGGALYFQGLANDPENRVESVSWDFGGATEPRRGEAGGEVLFSMPGNFVVTFEVIDDVGQKGKDSLTVYVAESTNERPSAVAYGNPQSGYAPLTVEFSAGASSDPDGRISAWIWDLGDGSAPVLGKVVTHTYREPGAYVVRMTARDNDGARATDGFVIEVKAAPPCDDRDGDGYSASGNPRCPGGELRDCNDDDGGVRPNAWEVENNGVDDDCDGHVDELVFDMTTMRGWQMVGIPVDTKIRYASSLCRYFDEHGIPVEALLDIRDPVSPQPYYCGMPFFGDFPLEVGRPVYIRAEAHGIQWQLDGVQYPRPVVVVLKPKQWNAVSLPSWKAPMKASEICHEISLAGGAVEKVTVGGGSPRTFECKVAGFDELDFEIGPTDGVFVKLGGGSKVKWNMSE